jgi:hypothetical protein
VYYFFVVGDAPSSTPPNADHSACIGDNSLSFPGATCVSSMGAMQTSLFIDDDESMPLKNKDLPAKHPLVADIAVGNLVRVSINLVGVSYTG